MNYKTKMLRTKAAGLVAAMALGLVAVPATASAETQAATTSPSADQYSPRDISFENNSGNTSGGGLDNSVGGLPFTGFDVIAMLAVALTVTGLGLALQRAVSREPRDLF